jgi:hypothetical protein
MSLTALSQVTAGTTTNSLPVVTSSSGGAALTTTHARERQLQRRVEQMLVRTVPQMRYQLARVGPVGLSGLGVILAAAISAFVLLLPANRSLVDLNQELGKVGHVGTTALDSGPGRQLFAATLPTRAQIPAVLGVVMVQANEAGIALEQGKYTYSAATPNRLARYAFEFPIKADYGNIRNFINKALQAAPALGLDKLQIERKNVGDALVSADVGFVIYMRGI